MKYSKSDFPTGATWQGETRHGKIVTIYKDESNNDFEIWRWSAQYYDESGLKFDWATSYRGCVNDAPVIIGRFKRIR